MKIIVNLILVLIISLITQNLRGQDEKFIEKVKILENSKDLVMKQEKEALKIEIEKINEQLNNNEITEVEAQNLKTKVAKKHAQNIDNRIAIINNQIELLERNSGQVLELDTLNYPTAIEINWGGKRANGDRLLGIEFTNNEKRLSKKRDRRTYSDPVLAIGFNNTLVEGRSLEDSPYELGGSRFFELGWAWRTRVFKKSNAVRLHYGFSFQFNGLKIKDNQYFVVNDGVAELEEFEFNLNKSKFRSDNLVFPVHFEFGPSKLRETKNRIRYSIQNQFRFGIGGYGGVNISTRQKLKYDNADGQRVKDKLKRNYNTSNFVYGLSAYAGFDGIQLYAKYDLNPIFKDVVIEQRNISLGVRFDLD